MPDSSLELGTRVRRLDDVLETEIDNETVMMDIEQGSYFGLNPVGSRIWALLADSIAIGDLCDRLTEEFEVPREQCEAQVFGFLENLLERGLVQVVTDEAA